MNSLLLFLVASYGWSLVFTQGAGPWRILDRSREVLRARAGTDPTGKQRPTLLSCAMCIGIWVGFALGALHLAAEEWDLASRALLILEMGGAAAGASWAGVHLIDSARRASSRRTDPPA